MELDGATGARKREGWLQRLLPKVMDEREYHWRRFRAYGLLAVFIAIVVVGIATDELGLVLGLILVVPFGARAVYHAWRMRRAKPGEQRALQIDGLPAAERPSAYRRNMWVGGGACAALGAWTAWTLYQLETGSANEVTVWGPIAPIYEHLGFWPAVLTWPALGALIVFESWRKGRAARASPPA